MKKEGERGRGEKEGGGRRRGERGRGEGGERGRGEGGERGRKEKSGLKKIQRRRNRILG